MNRFTPEVNRMPVKSDSTALRSRQRGLTLIELMVSLVIGLVLVGGVLSIFVSTRQTARVNDNLMRIQENARTAFDLMARDIREAGQNPCGSIRVANVLRSGGVIPVWADWSSGTLRGYDNTQDETGIKAFGTATNSRISGTDAVLVIKADQDENNVLSHNPDPSTVDDDTLITLSTASNFQESDIAFICDSLSSAIFQIYNVSGGKKVLDHQADGNMNCSSFLAFISPVTNCPTFVKNFQIKTETPEIKVSKLASSFWYLGYNDSGNGKRSLYRSKISRKTVGGKTVIFMSPEEMIPDVQDLQITYLTRNGTTGALASDWVAADTITNWSDDSLTTQVVAVRLDLTLQTSDNVSTSQAPIQRHLIHVIGLRNRDTFVKPSS